MATNHVEELKCLQESYGNLSKLSWCYESFWCTSWCKYKDGALSLKTKELIALGIAIVVKCTGCIQSHVKTAIDAGATREEIAETVGVAILMGGGPGTVYGAMALDAMEQYLAENNK